MSNINYEEEVKKVYPEAFTEYTFSNFRQPMIQWYIESNGQNISGDKSTKQIAWKSAYETLKQQGKL